MFHQHCQPGKLLLQKATRRSKVSWEIATLPNSHETYLYLSPSPSVQVCQVHFHPVLNWLASFDRNDYLTVWDWEKAEVVLECQLGSSGSSIGRQVRSPSTCPQPFPQRLP